MRAVRLAGRLARRELRRPVALVRTVAASRARVRPWFAARRHTDRYRLLDEAELRASRRSETLFLFGSGASLNDISAQEWRRFEEHDTMGFNWFVRQEFLRCDYHLIRGIPDTDLDPRIWKPQLEEYFDSLWDDPRFATTIFLVQTGFRATNGNRALGYGYLPPGSRVFLWRTNVKNRLPGRSFAEGLSHGRTTLQECINCAWLLGWKEIVLVGVDLYDRRYFWAPGDTRTVDSRRGAAAADPHAQATSGLVDDLGRWAKVLAETGTTLTVHNPRSLLAATLPVYGRRASRS